jgi:hypothetical protein
MTPPLPCEVAFRLFKPNELLDLLKESKRGVCFPRRWHKSAKFLLEIAKRTKIVPEIKPALMQFLLATTLDWFQMSG